ncbi:hypothetical protein M431DRAFT_316214 [Trichoderma harzianum CBS 226.95]|uniref:Uncharacterized protein n=1 Tax=Trichoderma harzianum CBS 226.95 TaxID=983964 RepID=A0A2T4ARX4_TRIHA|nr:hypothetical protein M431DRAFT_316214 [Trichoderma harzianum CBS 226.95]PTB59834.1 hypothetical protein M431DRAFT_316214 [Trichoderma harzianum CBS 226.95]
MRRITGLVSFQVWIAQAPAHATRHLIPAFQSPLPHRCAKVQAVLPLDSDVTVQQLQCTVQCACEIAPRSTNVPRYQFNPGLTSMQRTCSPNRLTIPRLPVVSLDMDMVRDTH